MDTQESKATRTEPMDEFGMLLQNVGRDFFVEAYRRLWPDVTTDAWWGLLMLEGSDGKPSLLSQRPIDLIEKDQKAGKDPLSLLDFAACCKIVRFYELKPDGSFVPGRKERGNPRFFRDIELKEPDKQREYLSALKELNKTRNATAHGDSAMVDIFQRMRDCRDVMQKILDVFPDEKKENARLWGLYRDWSMEVKKIQKRAGFPPIPIKELVDSLDMQGFPSEKVRDILEHNPKITVRSLADGDAVIGWDSDDLENYIKGLLGWNVQPAAPSRPDAPPSDLFAVSGELTPCRRNGGALDEGSLGFLGENCNLVADESLFVTENGRTWLQETLLPLLRRKGRPLLLDNSVAQSMLASARDKDRKGAHGQQRDIRAGVKLLARLARERRVLVCGSLYPEQSVRYNILKLVRATPDKAFCVITRDRLLIRRLGEAEYGNAVAVSIKLDGGVVLNLSTLPDPAAISGARKEEPKPEDRGEQTAPPPVKEEPSAPAPAPPIKTVSASHLPDGALRLRKNGKCILVNRAGSPIAEGGEGCIYATNDPAYVAKLYHFHCLTPEREKKLTLMLENDPQIDAMAWPVDILEDAEGNFLGFVMPKKEGVEMATSVMRPGQMTSKLPGWDRGSLAELCAAIAEVFIRLHKKGILMGDVNPRNILIRDSRTPYFIDCDSYQIGPYRCPVGTLVFTDPEIFRQQRSDTPNYASFDRTLENEYYALASLLFQVVMMGKAPFSKVGGGELIESIKSYRFAFPFGEDSTGKDAPIGPYRMIWSHFPYKLKEAFYLVFTGKEQRAAPEEWKRLFEGYVSLIREGKSTAELLPATFKEVNREGASKFILLRCDDCGREFSMDEDSYQKWADRKERPRCQFCNANARLNNNIRIRAHCDGCGQEKLIPRGRAAEMAEKGQPLFCDDCLEHKRELVSVTCSICGRSYETMRWNLESGRRPQCEECREKLHTKRTLKCPRCQRTFEANLMQLENAQEKGYTLECPNCRRELGEMVTIRCDWCGKEKATLRRNVEKAQSRGKRPICDDCRRDVRRR